MSTSDYLSELEITLRKAISNNYINLNKIRDIFMRAKEWETSGILFDLNEKFRILSLEDFKKNYFGLFTIVKNYLIDYIESNQLESLYITEKFIETFFRDFLTLLAHAKFCSNCFSTDFKNRFYPVNEKHLVYFCPECNDNVRVFNKPNFLLLYILYLDRFQQYFDKKKLTMKFQENFKLFLHQLVVDCFNMFSKTGSVKAQIFFYNLIRNNQIGLENFPDFSEFSSQIINNLFMTIRNQGVSEYLAGKEYYEKNFGKIQESSLTKMKKEFIEVFIKNLTLGRYQKLLEIKRELIETKFISLAKLKKHPFFESAVYSGLSKCLNLNYLDDFKKFLDFLTILDVHIKPENIPERFDKIFNAIEECVNSVNLGGIIEVLKLVNEYGLSYQRLNPRQLKLVSDVRNDILFMDNLRDLFGDFDASFIYFVHREMPLRLLDFVKGTDYIYPGYSEPEQIVDYILSYFSGYSIYGLSVKNLGDVSYFINRYQQHINKMQKRHSKELVDKIPFIKLKIRRKTHLISQYNMNLNLENMLEKNNYSFYTFSMVLLGGLGPEGHGFTYSTPRGELVEICSDRKESRAIIIKFKKYLKDTFLNRFTKELLRKNVSEDSVLEICSFLDNIIREDDYIDITKKKSLINKIQKYIFSNKEIKEIYKLENDHLITNISDAISVILRPVDLIDQFKVRMKLVEEDKIKSEDIPKLTSLKDKSHYDVLRERFFFQKIVRLFYQYFITEKNKQSRKKY